MTSWVTTVSLGLVLGNWAPGIWRWFLISTRPYRATRNMLVIRLGYLVIVVSGVGSCALLLGCLEQMGIGRARQGDVTLWVYAITLALSLFLTAREELVWRKSSDLLRNQ
jgi:membrane protease YdiL (CAAX protease family)